MNATLILKGIESEKRVTLPLDIEPDAADEMQDALQEFFDEHAPDQVEVQVTAVE